MAKKTVKADRERRRDEAVELLRQAEDIVSTLKEEVSTAYDNMPEGLQQGEQGQRLEEAASSLDNVGIEDAMSALEEIEF